MKALTLPYKVGILGGGQLARMLVLKAHEMGIEPHVLSLHSRDPGAQVTCWWTQGDPNDPLVVEAFLSQVNVATFESEFYSATSLSQAADKTQTPLFPQPGVMALLQDRWPQKQTLDKYDVPTSPYVAVNNATDLSEAQAKLGIPLVLKKRRFGYDGYGTIIVKSKSQLNKALSAIENEESGFIAEAFIPFQRELAVMLVRSRDKSLAIFPLVESFQRDARCLWVKGPVQHQRWSRFKAKLIALVEGINYVGAMGIEMFDTGSELLVNELAPRVHNSGHYTMDAMSEDQFSLHLRAILGLPLGTPQSRDKGFAMYNLLGSGQSQGLWKLPAAVHLHWYGKSESRKGRKMGHINCTDKTPDQALERLIQARRQIKI